MGNNDNRVVTHVALNQFIIENGGSPKNNNANSYAIPFGEFNQYAPMYDGTNAGVVINDYTGIGGGAYSSNQLVIEKDVTWRGADAPVIVLPTGITVTPDATLNPGQTQQLTAVVLPDNATDKSVTWSSENTSVATVDQNGLVTAVDVGQPVKIYATSNADPNVSGYATITVVATPVTRYSISWSGDHVSIPGSTSPVQQNEGTSWNGTFVPENGYQIDNITYTGNNVQKDGNTVSVSNLTSDVIITITTSQIPQPVEITLDADDVELSIGESKWIPWQLSDSSVEMTTITYDIEDESIATMSTEEGKEQYVVGVSRGETTAVVTVNGEYTDTVTITVNGIFDNYDVDTTPKHDIFGNIDISNNVVHDSNQGVITLHSIPQNLVDQIQIDVEYDPASASYKEGESGWIPANSITLTPGDSGTVTLKYTVEPYTKAIDAIKAYAAASTESDGKLIVEASYVPDYVNPNVYPTSTDYGRDAIIKLTAPDGSSLQYPIHQRSCISYHSRTNSGKSLNFGSSGMMAFYKESGSKPETVDVYGTPGTTLADESTYYFPGSVNIFYPVGISGFQPGEIGSDTNGLVTIAHFGTINGVSEIPDVISGSHGRHVATIPDGFVKVGTINGYAIQWS